MPTSRKTMTSTSTTTATKKISSLASSTSSSVSSDSQRDASVPPIWVVFGRPGAGKSTVADAAVDLFNKNQQKQQDSTTLSQQQRKCQAIDLDVCIPQWMKDNFTKGIYPTLDERTAFAYDACDYVVKRIREEFPIPSNDKDHDHYHAVVISFSFVNIDLRDVFRTRFPHARWVLIDTTEQDAEERILLREDHFYTGEKKPPSVDSDIDNNVTEKDDDGEENSEWKFAPVEFPHTLLDGRAPIETNARIILEDMLSTIG
jgi:hypothetical protein